MFIGGPKKLEMWAKKIEIELFTDFYIELITEL